MGASELFESDKEIAEKYDTYSFRGSSIGEELAVEVIRDIKGLTKSNGRKIYFQSQELDCI